MSDPDYVLLIVPAPTLAEGFVAGPQGVPGIEVITGTIGFDVPSAPGDGIGTRPLASTKAIGTIFQATDQRYIGMVGPHAFDSSLKVWHAIVSSRSVLAVAGVGGTQANWLGVYDPNTNIFTRTSTPGQLGQFCNAVANATTAEGANVVVNISPGSITGALGTVTPMAAGTEVMVDANGQLQPYVAGVGRVPLGFISTSAVSGSLGLATYSW